VVRRCFQSPSTKPAWGRAAVAPALSLLWFVLSPARGNTTVALSVCTCLGCDSERAASVQAHRNQTLSLLLTSRKYCERARVSIKPTIDQHSSGPENSDTFTSRSSDDDCCSAEFNRELGLTMFHTITADP
jgi:hypothetical protein